MAEHTVNEHLLKITGKVAIPIELKLGTIYDIAMRVAVRGIETEDRDDGTLDLHYKCRATGPAALKDELGQVHHSKDKKSQSQKLRWSIMQLCPEQRDKDAFYEEIMGKIRFHLPEIIKLVEDK